MWSDLWSGCIQGLEASLVQVEIDLQKGLPSFCVVGLPDAAIRESKDRVRSALKNSGFTFPMKRVTVNLAPAHVKKEGSSFELAIALGLLMAEGGWNSKKFNRSLFLGELSLKGELHPIKGILPIILEAKRKGFESIFMPKQNSFEASIVPGISIYPIEKLADVVSFLRGETSMEPLVVNSMFESVLTPLELDFSDVRGQTWAKQSMAIAAAGGASYVDGWLTRVWQDDAR